MEIEWDDEKFFKRCQTFVNRVVVFERQLYQNIHVSTKRICEHCKSACWTVKRKKLNDINKNISLFNRRKKKKKKKVISVQFVKYPNVLSL